MGTYTPGSNARPLQSWRKSPVRSTGNAKVIITGLMQYSTTGIVSNCVSDGGISVISNATVGTGAFRIYFPACKRVICKVDYVGSAGFTATARILAPTSGYADVVVQFGTVASVPVSGQYMQFALYCDESNEAIAP